MLPFFTGVKSKRNNQKILGGLLLVFLLAVCVYILSCGGKGSSKSEIVTLGGDTEGKVNVTFFITGPVAGAKVAVKDKDGGKLGVCTTNGAGQCTIITGIHQGYVLLEASEGEFSDLDSGSRVTNTTRFRSFLRYIKPGDQISINVTPITSLAQTLNSIGKVDYTLINEHLGDFDHFTAPLAIPEVDSATGLYQISTITELPGKILLIYGGLSRLATNLQIPVITLMDKLNLDLGDNLFDGLDVNGKQILIVGNNFLTDKTLRKDLGLAIKLFFRQKIGLTKPEEIKAVDQLVKFLTENGSAIFPQHIEAKIDQTPPVVKITNPQKDVIVSKVIKIEAHATEDDNHIDKIEIIKPPITNASPTLSGKTASISALFDTQSLKDPEGDITIRVQAKNLYDKTGTDTITVKYDNKPPVISLEPVSVKHGDIVNQDFKIKAKCEDTSGILELKIEGNDVMGLPDQDPKAEIFQATFNTASIKTRQNINFHFIAKDVHGNVSRFPETGEISVLVNKDAPTINLFIRDAYDKDTILKDQQKVAGIVKIIVKAFDPDGLSNDFILKIDDKAVSAIGQGGEYKYIWDTTQIPDGDYEIFTKISDITGNEGKKNITIKVDNQPPINISGVVSVGKPMQCEKLEIWDYTNGQLSSQAIYESNTTSSACNPDGSFSFQVELDNLKDASLLFKIYGGNSQFADPSSRPPGTIIKFTSDDKLFRMVKTFSSGSGDLSGISINLLTTLSYYLVDNHLKTLTGFNLVSAIDKSRKLLGAQYRRIPFIDITGPVFDFTKGPGIGGNSLSDSELLGLANLSLHTLASKISKDAGLETSKTYTALTLVNNLAQDLKDGIYNGKENGNEIKPTPTSIYTLNPNTTRIDLIYPLDDFILDSDPQTGRNKSGYDSATLIPTYNIISTYDCELYPPDAPVKTYDRKGPEIKIDKPIDSQIYRGKEVELYATANDIDGTVSLFKMDPQPSFIKDFKVDTTDAKKHVMTGKIDTTKILSDTYTLKFSAIDDQDNLSSPQDNKITIKIDNIPPTITITSPETGRLYSGSNETITAEAFDINGVKQFVLNPQPDFVDNLTVDTADPNNHKMTFTIDTTQITTSTYTITFMAKDSKDNGVTKDLLINIDNEEPEIIVDSPKLDIFYRRTIEISAEANDNQQMKDFRLLNNDPFINVTVDKTDTKSYKITGTIDTTKITADTYTLNFYAEDAVGKIMPKYIPFKVDNKAPKLVIIKPLNGSHHSGNVDLKAIAEDDKELSVIGVTNIELRRNFIEKRISNTQKELIGGFDSRVAPYPEYGINFVAKDSAGNESTKQIIIIIENTTTIEERGN